MRQTRWKRRSHETEISVDDDRQWKPCCPT